MTERRATAAVLRDTAFALALYVVLRATILIGSVLPASNRGLRWIETQLSWKILQLREKHAEFHDWPEEKR